MTIAIRPWERDDEAPIKQMLLDHLEHGVTQGLAFAVCDENADALWQMGIGSAERDEGTVLALVDGVLAGLSLCGHLPSAFVRRYVVWESLATFVAPAFRHQGVAMALYRDVGARAKAAGVRMGSYIAWGNAQGVAMTTAIGGVPLSIYFEGRP